MKVNLYITEEVSDEDRKAISESLGVKLATRDQIKEFMWSNGESWRTVLSNTGQALGQTSQPEADELDSLL